MKKILIPIIGLLVLIILTPLILSNIMNSNIDKKIANFQNEGIKIKEVKKDISYLTTKRVFEVELNDNTKLPAWKAQKLINELKFKVVLTFKNLPITKANFDVENKNFKLHLITKNMKNFNVVGESKFIKFNGVYHKSKFDTFSFNITDLLNYKIKNLKLNGEIKDLALYLGSLDIKGDMVVDYDFNIINFTDKIDTHLKPNNKYFVNENFYAQKFYINDKGLQIAFKDFNETTHLFNTDIKNKITDGNSTITFTKTGIQNKIADGAEIKIKFKNLSQDVNKLYLTLDANLSKSLFEKVTLNLDPKKVKEYFNNYSTHIEIKDKKVFINGHRVF